MLSAKPDRIGAEWITAVQNAGYDYLEMPLAEMTQIAEPDFQQLKSTVKASGMICEACNNLFPRDIRLTGSQRNLQTIEDYLNNALDRAAQLGVQVVTFGSGPAKSLPDGLDPKVGFQQVTEVTALLSDMAVPYGITIAIEPLRKPECNIINTFAEGVTLAKAVQKENCKVLVDFYHMAYEQESPHILLEYGRDYLAHVHFANPAIGLPNERNYPEQAAEWDYQPFAAALQAIPYDGRISVEAFCRHDVYQQLAHSLAVMKTIFRK